MNYYIQKKGKTPLKSACRFLRGFTRLAKLFAVLLCPFKKLSAKSFDKPCVQKTKGRQVKIIHYGLMFSYLASCLLAFGVKIKTAYAEDCSCCGGCNIDEIIGAITNATQSACSSNCVSMSPQDCEYFKHEVSSICYEQELLASSLYSQLDELRRNWEQAIYKVGEIKNNVDNIKDFIDEVSITNVEVIASMSNSVQTVIQNCIAMTNFWARVDGSNNQMLFVSNIVSGVTLKIPVANKVSIKIGRLVLPRLYHILDLINSSYVNFAEVYDNIDSIQESLEEITLLPISSEIQIAQSDAENLLFKTLDLSERVQSLDCSPCGNGGDSSGGSGGGGSSTDLSPLIYEVQYLRQRLDYHLDRLYDLFCRLFDDYTSAANNPVTFHSTTSDLSGMKNWFSRVEMLLYNVQDGRGELFTDYAQARSSLPSLDPADYGSGVSANNWFIRVEQLLGMIAAPKGDDVIGDDKPTDPPEDIANSDSVKDFDRAKEQAENNAEQEQTSIGNTIQGGWERVRKSLSDLAQSFSNRFGGQYTNIDGMSMEIYLSVGDSPTVDLLQVPEGFSSRMKIFRDILNVFWLILFSVLYIAAFKMIVSVTIKYILWFAQVSSATFGN